MTLEKMLGIIESGSAHFESNKFASIEVPFPIKAVEYLRYAEEDLLEETTRGLVNALSNAKRALDARVESVLIAFGLYSLAKEGRWSVPRKLERLSSLGIVTPRVLAKLNRARNLIEHEFHKPTAEQVKDFVDVVALFHEGTRIYLHSVPNDAEIMDGDSGEFFVFNLIGTCTDPKLVLNRGKHELYPKDPYYERFVNGYARMIQQWYED